MCGGRGTKADCRPSAFRPDMSPICGMTCERPWGAADSWGLPLAAAAAVTVAVIPRDSPRDGPAVQGMARARSGHAPAWPLSSDRSVRRSPASSVTSRVHALGTLHLCSSPCGHGHARCRRGGNVRSAGHPGCEAGQDPCTCPFTWSWTKWSPSNQVRAVVSAGSGRPRAPLRKRVAAVPRRRSGRLCRRRGSR